MSYLYFRAENGRGVPRVQVAARGPGPHYKMIRLNEKMPLNLGGLEFFARGFRTFTGGLELASGGLTPRYIRLWLGP